MSYYIFTSGTNANAEQVMDTFRAVWQGDRLPFITNGSGTLTANDGVYSLGQSTAAWYNVIAQKIICSEITGTAYAGTITANCNLTIKSEITLTATASSIEISGIKGSEWEVIDIVCYLPTQAVSGASVLGIIYINNDLTTTNYSGWALGWDSSGINWDPSLVYFGTSYNIDVGFARGRFLTRYEYWPSMLANGALSYNRLIPSRADGEFFWSRYYNASKTITTLTWQPIPPWTNIYQPGTKIIVRGLK
jgi:hypothetical protein